MGEGSTDIEFSLRPLEWVRVSLILIASVNWKCDK